KSRARPAAQAAMASGVCGNTSRCSRSPSSTHTACSSSAQSMPTKAANACCGSAAASGAAVAVRDWEWSVTGRTPKMREVGCPTRGFDCCEILIDRVLRGHHLEWFVEGQSTPFRAKVFSNRCHDGGQEFVAKRCVFGAANVPPLASRDKNPRAGSGAASEGRCALGQGLRVLRWLGPKDGANYKGSGLIIDERWWRSWTPLQTEKTSEVSGQAGCGLGR